VRVVGYVRESPGLADTETAYAQGERIRRWVAHHGHHLVAVCRDVRTPSGEVHREGYRALLHIVRAGDADAVVVSELGVLSPDKVMQEIMIHDLRSHGVTVVSTDPREADELIDPPHDATRLVIRDVLARAADYAEEFSTLEPSIAVVPPPPDVVVELLPPESPVEWTGGDSSAAHTARPSA